MQRRLYAQVRRHSTGRSDEDFVENLDDGKSHDVEGVRLFEVKLGRWKVPLPIIRNHVRVWTNDVPVKRPMGKAVAQ